MDNRTFTQTFFLLLSLILTLGLIPPLRRLVMRWFYHYLAPVLRAVSQRYDNGNIPNLNISYMRHFYPILADSSSGWLRELFSLKRSSLRGVIPLLLTLTFVGLFGTSVLGQTTIAFQGGEAGASNCWSVTYPTQATGTGFCVPVGGPQPILPRSGTNSLRASGGCTDGCNANPLQCISGVGQGQGTCTSFNGTDITLSVINIAPYDGAQFSVYHRSHGCAAAGFETDDILNFQVNENGGGFVTNSQINGAAANYNWDYTISPAGGTLNTPNPYVYNVPGPCVRTFQFRASMQRGANPRVDEVFYLDDVLLTFTQGKAATASATTICAGQSVTFTANACVITDGNWLYQWQRSTDGGVTFVDLAGETNSTLVTATINNNDRFRVRYSPGPGAQGGGCTLPVAFSPGIIITVNPVAVAGAATVNNPLTICRNTTKTLTLAGNTGSIQWQEDPGCTGTFNNLVGGNVSPFVTPGLLTTTCFRAFVTNGGCTAISNTLTVTVNQPTVAGTASITPSVICDGQTVDLSLTGQLGTTLRWQEQIDCAGGFTNIVGATTANFTTAALSGTSRCFRAVVQNAPCAAANSNTVRVDISPASVGGTATVTPNPVCEFDNITLTLNGQTGDHQWYEDIGCAGFFSPIGNLNDNPLIYTPPFSGLMCYRAEVTSPSCPPAFSNIVQVDVNPFPFVGFAVEGLTFQTDLTVCQGSNANLFIFGNNGVLQWQEDPGCTNNFTDLVGGNVNSFNVTVNALTCYRAQITSGVCQPLVSNIITINVDPVPNPGTITASPDPACTGDNVDLTITGQVGDWLWEEDLNCTGNFNFLFNSFDVNPLVLTGVTAGTHCYRITVFSGTCVPDVSTPVSFTVNDPPIAGTASADQTVCQNATANLTLAGQTGTIQWEEDPGCINNFNAVIGATQVNFTTAPLAQTTCYRAAVSTPGCPTAVSNTVTISVDPSAISGTASADQTICENQGAVLVLTGSQGNIQWQQDNGCTGGYVDMVGANIANYTTPSLAVGTYCFRAVLSSGTCPQVISNSIIATVSPATVAGTANSSTTICTNNAASILLTGFTGNIQWQDDPLCTNTFTNIAGQTNPTLTTAPLTQTTCYRAVVTSPGCPSANSNIVRIDVDPTSVAGTATATPTNLCLGQTSDLSLVGNTGNIQWQEDPGCVNNFVNIGGINANPLTVTPIVGQTCYRAQVTSGQCPPQFTGIVTVTVSAAPVAGNATANQTLCSGTGATMNLAGSSGNIQWQEDPLCANAFVNLVGQTNASLTTAPLTQTTCYRAVVSSGICASVNSNTVTITIDPNSVAGTPNFSNSLLCLGQTTDLTLTGQTGNFQWQQDPGCVNAFVNVGAPNASPLTVTPGLGQTCYRAQVTSGVCPTVITGTMTINVSTPPVAGNATADQTVCFGGGATINLGGSTGTIQWQSDVTCNNAFTDMGINNTPTLNVGPLAGTTCYRARVSATGCADVFSNQVRVQVDPASVAGTINHTGNNLCLGQTTDLSLTGQVGTIQWQQDPGCINTFTNFGVVNANPITVTPAVGQTCYRAQVTSGVCPAQFSGIITVTVSAAPVAGNATANQTVCNGSGATMNLAGSSGNIQWQDDALCTGTFTNIAGQTNATLNIASLTQTTCYRAVVSSGVCTAVNSNTVTITVDPASVAGTINHTGNNLCLGQTTNLSLTGQVGTIQWQQDPGCINTFTNFGVVNANPITVTPAVGQTCYRAQVTSGVCPAQFSGIITVTVSAAPVAGNATANQTVCNGSGATMNLAGSSGNIQWQNDALCTGTFTNIAGQTNTTLNIASLTQTTCYRTVVSSGVCTAVNSNTVTITVDPASVAGTPNASSTLVCQGQTVNLTLAGQTGNFQWQQQTGCAGGFSNIGALNTSPLTVTPAVGQTCYRAQVTSGTCVPVLTTTLTVTTGVLTIAGTVNSSQSICRNSSANLTLVGSQGNIQWEQQTNCAGGFSNVVNATNANFNTGALTQTMCYRTNVSSPGCPTLTSNVVTVTVDPTSVAGNASASATVICEGTNVDLTLAGFTGTIQWQQQTNCAGGFVNVGTPNTNPITVTPVPGNTCYRAQVTSGGCPSAISNVISVSTTVNPVAGVAAANQTICTGTGATITLAGSAGTIQWQRDPLCTNTFTNIAGANAPTLNTPALTQNTCYRAQLSSANCATVTSNIVTITVSPASVSGTPTATPTSICVGQSSDLTLAGNTGTFQWQQDLGCAGNYSNVGAPNSSPLTVTPPVGQTCYRAQVTSGSCPTVTTSIVRVTVTDNPVAGTASADQTICRGAAANLTLAGHTGNIQWQRDATCTNTFTNVANATLANFNTGALTTTTCFRVSVSTPNCTAVTTNTVTVQVDQPSVAGTASVDLPTVCQGGNVQLSIAGQTGNHQWQEDPGCSGFFANIGTLNANPLTAGPVNVLTCYRAVVTNGACASVNTNVVQVNITIPPTVGTAGEFFTRQTNVIVCNGDNSSMSVDAFSGSIQWQQDPNCTGTFTDIVGAVFNPYDAPAINGTICFRAVISRGACPSVVSNIITYTTYPNPVAGTATVDVTNICQGGTINLTITGHTGTPQWQEDAGCAGNYVNISGLGDVNFAQTINQSSCYRAIVFSGTCPPVFTNILNVTVDANPVAGTAGTDQTICTGNTVDLDVTGFTGNLQWQDDPGCINNFTDIAGETNPTLTSSPLAQNTCFRVRVSNGSCPDVFSNTVVITVIPALVAGTASSDQTVCFGSSATVSLAGNSNGSFIQWQYDDNCLGIFNDLPFENGNTANTGGIVQPTCFRAKISSNGCPDVFTNTVRIDLYPVAQPGNVAVNPIQVCEGGVVQVTITGQVGNHQWQEDPNCLGVFTDIGTPNANPLVTGPVNVFTCYRAIVTSGTCPPETTNVDQVAVDPMTNPGFAFDLTSGGTQTTVCEGSSVTMLVVGAVGDIQWQEEPGCVGGFTDIPGATTALYIHPQVLTQTCFRAMVTSGVCTSIGSNIIQYDVDPQTVTGTINAVPNPVCAGSTTVLTITGQTGSFFWEEDPGCTGGFVAFGVTNQNPITSNPINATTCYRATVFSGVCPALQTAIVQVDVSTPPVTGVASANPTVVCTGVGTTLDLVGFTGSIQWQEDTNCTGTFTDITGATFAPFNTNGLSVNTCFRASISTLNCPAVFSNIVNVTVSPQAVAGTPAVSQSIVCNGNTVNLTLTGNVGDIQWEEDPGCTGVTYTPVGPLNANPYILAPPLGLTCYRASVTSPGCLPAAVTVPVQVQVNPQTVAGNATADQTVCIGLTANLTLTGSVGNIQWQRDANCTGTFTNILNETNATLTTPANGVNTCYRAVVQSPGCTALNSNTVTITVTPQSVAGTPTAAPTVLCAGQTTNLTLAGNTGVIQWQEDFGCTGNFVNIGNLNDNPHIATPAVGQTCYRAQVTSGACPTVTTSTVIVNTSASPIPGVASADQTICRGSSATMNLVGSVGTIQWQSQVNCAGAFNNIAGAINPTFTTPAMVNNTCFRVNVTNPGCGTVTSNTVTITVNLPSVAGTPTINPLSVCLGNTTTLSLAANVGTFQWQEDPGCIGTFTDIGPVNTTPFVLSPSFIGSTCYRARVQSGVCPSVFTTVVSVLTSPQPVAGTAISDQTICTGQSATIDLQGSIGTVQWQNQVNCAGAFNNMPGQTNVTLLAGPLLATTCYRANVTNPGCGTVTSNTVRITVNAASVAGVISVNNTTVCEGQTVSLSIAGKTGTHQFEEDPGCLGIFTPIGAQNANPLVINPPVGQTCYRAVVQSGVCPPVITNLLTVTVGVTPIAGNAISDQTICTGASATVDLIGSTGNIQWQEQINCAGAFANNLFTTPSFNTGSLVQTRCYRAQVSSPGCATVTSNTVRITVSPATVAGTANHTGNTLCQGQTTNLTLTGNTGTFQWQQATDCVTYTNTGAPNTTPLTVTPPVGVTCYRAVVQSGACPPQFTGVITVTVGQTPIAGNITGTNPVCTGGAANLVLNGSTGTIQWEQQNNCAGGFNPVGTNSPNYNTGPLVQNTCFRATVSSPGCASVQTAVFTVTVSNVSVAGTVTANNNTVCNASPVTLTLTGSTGTIQWQEQPLCTGAFTNIGIVNTNPLVTGPLTANRCYRAVVTNGSCPAETTNVVTIQVDQPPVAGTITANQTICATTGVTLTLTGTSGNIQWQSDPLCANTFTNIAGETAPTYNTGALNQTTCYRATLSSGVCTQVISPISRVTVDPVSVPGTATASATSICAGQNVTITLAGSVGTIQWQQQANCAGGFVNTGAPNVNPLTVIGFNARTCYRAVVTSGVCPATTSNTVDLVVAPITVAGTAAALPPNVCQGLGTSLELTGSVGQIRWQEQPNCAGGFTDIVGGITTPFLTGPINIQTCYRAILQSGTCAPETTNVATVTVDTPTNPGTLSASQNVCQGNHNTTLTLAGFNGNILRWESSTDNFVANTTVIVNVTPTFNAVNLNQNTCYRVVVDNGDCPQQISNVVCLTVDVPPIAGNATLNPTQYCASGDANLTLTGSSGNINWQSTTNCANPATYVDIPARTNAVEVIPAVNITTCYRARVSNGTCPDVFSNPVQLLIDQNNTGGTLTPAFSTVCSGATVNLTLSGFVGTIEEWQISDNIAFNPITNIPGTGPTNTTPVLNTTSYVRVRVRNGLCAPTFSAVAEIVVTAPTIAGTLTPASPTVCTGSNITLTLAGNQGAVVQWETSPTPNFSPIVTTLVTNALSQTYTNVNGDFYVRVMNQNGPQCPGLYSNIVHVVVTPTSVAGIASVDRTPICPSEIVTLTLAGNVGSIQWEDDPGCNNVFTPINGATANTYTTPALNQTHCYRATVTSGTCPSVTSNIVNVTVGNLSVGGTLSSDATVCGAVNNATILTLAGFTGTVNRWEISNDPNFVPAVTLPASQNQTIYTVNNLVQTSYVRAVVQNAPCPEVFSTSVTITVDPPTTPGVLTADASSVCAGANTVNFTLTGNIGAIQRWEKSIDGGATWQTIVNITNNHQENNNNINIDVRVWVKSGSCPAVASNTVRITVQPQSQGGLLSGQPSICRGASFLTITLTGQVGTVQRWESSTDNFGTQISGIPNQTTQLPGFALLQTTCFRAVVVNGVCPPANSAMTCVVVDQPPVAGNLGAPATACTGGNNGTLTLTGHVGSILRWESAPDQNFNAPVNTISVVTNTYTWANLNQTTCFRAVVGNGVCPSINSNLVCITIDPTSQPGIITGGTTVCAPINTTVLNVTGQTGNVVRWEISDDNFITTTPVNNTGTQFIAIDLVRTTCYRVVVQSGVCPPVTSNSACIIVVTPAPDPIITATPTNACVNAPVALTSNNPLPGVGVWSCVGANCASALIGNTNAINTTVTFTSPGVYVIRRTHSGPQAPCVPSDKTVTITVVDQPTVSNAGPDQSLCATDATLQGNAPVIGTGQWIVMSGTGTITSPTNPNTTVTGLAPGANVFRWRISNPPCALPSDDDVTITRFVPPLPANAGPDVDVCNQTVATIIAGAIGSGTGIWSFESGNPSATIVTNGLSGSIVGMNTPGQYCFRWTVSNPPCAPVFDIACVNMIIPPLQPTSLNGPTTICQGTTGRYTTTPVAGETYVYTTVPAGPIVTPQNSNLEADIQFNTAGNYVVVITPRNVCAAGPVRTLIVTVNPVAAPNAGLDRTVCGASTVLIGNPNGGAWTCPTCPPTVTIANAGPFGIVGNMPPNQPLTFRYTVPNNNCGQSFDEVIITNDLAVPGFISANNTTVCAGSPVTLTLNAQQGNVVRWESSTDGGVSWLQVPNSVAQTSITFTPTMTTNFRVFVNQTGVCQAVATPLIMIVVSPNATASVTPANFTTCNPNITLAGNPLPEGATGVWTQQSGPQAVINTSGINGQVSGMNQPGVYVFRWTVTNPPCAPSFADATITKIDAPVANAGTGQNICGNVTTATLTGNIPNAGTASWSQISGPAATLTQLPPNKADVTNMNVAGTYVFRYTISNPPCAPTTADVSIVKYDVPAPDAGPDLTTCSQVAQLRGNDPAPNATGSWSFLSGPGGGNPLVQNFNGYFANVSNLNVPGVYTFVYTISHPQCGNLTDQMTLTVLDNSAVAQVQQPNVSVCGVADATIQAVAPQSGSGTWSVMSFPPNVPNVVIQTVGTQGNISGMTLPGQYRFRWTVVNACGTTTADVVVTRQDPAVAFAGQDQFVCNTAFALVQGNPVPSGCTGRWKFINGPFPADVTTLGVYGSVVNMNVAGQYIFEWSFDCPGSVCPAASSIIRINRLEPPTFANAGPAQTICGNTALLNGNTPVVGTPSWSVVSGSPVPNIQNANSPNATVNGLSTGVYRFRYTVANPPCAPSVSDVVVTVYAPTVAGFISGAGAPSCAGNNSGTLTLSGFEGNIVRWESSPNGGFTPINIIPNNTSLQNYSNLTETTCYRAVVKSGTCPEATSTTVCVNVVQQPTVASAGPDQQICANNITLTGNTPVNGTATWRLISGSPVPTLNITGNGTTAVITNLAPGTYVYEYEIANAPCAPSKDQVVLTVTGGSQAGSVLTDQTFCSATNSGILRLSGYVGNVIRWEMADDINFTVNAQTITNITNTYLFNNIPSTKYIRAVVQTGTCPTSNSTPARITITERVTADAGADQQVCGTAFVLTGNDPGTGIGTWTLASGPAPAPTLSQSGRTLNVSNVVTGGNYVFQYRITNGNCTPSTDFVVVNVATGSVAGVVNSDQTICSGQSGTLVVTGITGSVVRWESSTQNWLQGSINQHNNPATQFTYTNLTQTTQFRAVIKNGGCPEATSPHVTVVVNQPPSVANAGSNQTVCSSSTVLTGNIPVNGTGTWTFVSSDNGQTPTVVSSVNQGFVSNMNRTGNYIFQYQITNAPCGASTAQVLVTVVNAANPGNVNGPATVCAGTNSTTLTLTGFTGTIVRWESADDAQFQNGVQTIANTNSIIIVNNLTTTRYFRPVVEVVGCSSVNGQPVQITVSQASLGGVLSANQTVCRGSNTGVLTLTGQIGTVISWESSPNDITYTTISNPLMTHTFSNLTQDTWFRVNIQNAPCGATKSSKIKVTVVDAPLAGTVGNNQTICSLTNQGTLTLTGHQGNIIRWERATDPNNGPWTSITNITTSQNYLNLTQTTFFRAIVQTGGCPEAPSQPAQITLDLNQSGGTLSAANQTVCSGSNNVTLTLTGHTGAVTQWEVSNDNFGSIAFSVVTNATTLALPADLTQNTQVRAVSFSGGCTLNSTVAIITVAPATVGGTVNASQTVCAPTNSGSFTLTGHTGTVLRWESTTDPAFIAGITSTSSNLTTIAFTNLTQTTYYRAVVQNAPCGAQNSTVASVTVTPASVGGTIAGANGACGGTASGTLTLSGQVGTVLRWESSTSPSFSPVSSTTTNLTTLAYTNLTVTTYYRAVVQSGNCATANSATATVLITPPPVAGTLSSNGTVCNGTNSGVLTLSGFSGTVVRWESATNSGFTQNLTTITNTTSSNTYLNLTQTTFFRAVIGNGVCPTVNSNSVMITVLSPLTLNAVAVVGCTGVGSIQATATGGNGGTYTYSIVPAVAPNNNTGVFSSIGQGTYTVRVQDNFGCFTTQTVTVGNTPTPPTITSVTNITQSSGVIAWANMGTGVTYTFRYRILGSPTWTVVSNLSSTTLFLSSLQNNTTYEIQVSYRCPNNGPQSGFSTGNITQFTTLGMGSCDLNATVQPIPGGLFLNNVTPTTAQVNWNRVPNAIGYIINWGPITQNQSLWAQMIVCDPITSQILNNLLPNTTYGVRIRTNCSNCTTALGTLDKRSNWSIIANFSTPISRELLESVVATTSPITVYPNPNKGVFTISFQAETVESVKVRLYDVTGKLVFDRTQQTVAGENEVPVEMAGYSSGVYLLQVERGGKLQTIKVMVE